MSDTVALIVAAGRGSRAAPGPAGVPKQYRPLAGRPVLRWGAEAFARHPAVAKVRIVIHGDDRAHYEVAMSGLALGEAIAGGATRQDSVRLGLEALAADRPACVLIHDAARPFVSQALIGRICDALDGADAAAPMLPVADTLRRETSGQYDIVARDGLLRTQTPQGFRFDAILDAHRRFKNAGATDDIALAGLAGLGVVRVPGEEANLKLTTPDDFALAERIAAGAQSDVRTGFGFDVHRFAPGDHLWLCGVKIPHDAGLAGHSDADAGLHALTDALLGTIGAGDIGAHFPPSDAQWKGAPSHVFLAHAARLVRERGGTIGHADVTLICERPRIGPHREAMRARIAEILDIERGRVSVKATTTEGLGFTGRAEGVAAQAVTTVRLPS